MSTIWTPGGERPVGQPAAEPAPTSGPEPELSDEELDAQMAELRDQLARTPVAVVVANHCFGLFELAALHLSLQPPQLEASKLAIDALGLLVEGLAGRLGDDEQQLRDGLAQLRLAFVQISGGADQPAEGEAPATP